MHNVCFLKAIAVYLLSHHVKYCIPCQFSLKVGS